MKKVLQQGAEAIIYLDKDKVIKDRIKKSYRISELDDKIRKQRTKSETKLLEKASNIINSVTPLKTNEKFSIEMPFIEGRMLLIQERPKSHKLPPGDVVNSKPCISLNLS